MFAFEMYDYLSARAAGFQLSVVTISSKIQSSKLTSPSTDEVAPF